MNDALIKLLPIFGFNFRFHFTEILIDVAYQFPHLVNLYEDFYVGPGAIPTARLLSPDEAPTLIVDQCVGKTFPKEHLLTFNNKPVILSAENWEGIFCEYRKYTNLKNGQGRKRLYKPKY